MASDTAQTTADEGRRDALRGRWALAVIAAAYFVFLLLYVPRLNNFVMSDREFTGWVGPIAERLARGQRLYDDLVLPIPPGSFVLLAAIHKVAGGPLLLHELWVAAAAHLLMGLMAYAIAVKFSTRKVALLVALTTLVVVTQTPKECVYDHTSLLVAWLSVLAGSHATLEEAQSRRKRLWFLTGLSATATLIFKQSTAVGMTAGWLLALTYLFVVDKRAERHDEARARLSDVAHWAAGGAAGLVTLVLLLLALR